MCSANTALRTASLLAVFSENRKNLRINLRLRLAVLAHLS